MKLIEKKKKNRFGISKTFELVKEDIHISGDKIYSGGTELNNTFADVSVDTTIFWDLNSKLSLQTYNSVGFKVFMMEKELENKTQLI